MSLVSILVAVLVFGLLIFVHELGHFLTAKWSGVRVNEFALGMGPALLQFTRGETQYSLRLLPIGGYCAMEGEDEDSNDAHAFCNAKISRRIMIIIAGSLMNLLLGLVLLTYLTTQQDMLGSTVVAGFHPDASSNAQLQPGDQILRVNGHRVRTSNDLVYEFTRDRDGIMDMLVLRDGQEVHLQDVTFRMDELEDGLQSIYVDITVLGVEKTFFGTVRHAFNWTLSIVKQVWGSLIDLVTGRYTINQLSGPVGVTAAIGEATSRGYTWLITLVSFITVNLGVFNLLPLPALDGGRLMFLLLEAVRRKPINPRYEGWVHAAGFMLLIGLMLFVTFNDVVRLVLN